MFSSFTIFCTQLNGSKYSNTNNSRPIGCRIQRLLLCRGIRPPNECSRYDTKQFDGEVQVKLEIRGMWSTPLLPSLLGLLWPRVVAPDKGLINGLNRTKRWLKFIVFFAFKLCIYAEMFEMELF